MENLCLLFGLVNRSTLSLGYRHSYSLILRLNVRIFRPQFGDDSDRTAIMRLIYRHVFHLLQMQRQQAIIQRTTKIKGYISYYIQYNSYVSISISLGGYAKGRAFLRLIFVVKHRIPDKPGFVNRGIDF